MQNQAERILINLFVPPHSYSSSCYHSVVFGQRPSALHSVLLSGENVLVVGKKRNISHFSHCQRRRTIDDFGLGKLSSVTICFASRQNFQKFFSSTTAEFPAANINKKLSSASCGRNRLLLLLSSSLFANSWIPTVRIPTFSCQQQRNVPSAPFPHLNSPAPASSHCQSKRDRIIINPAASRHSLDDTMKQTPNYQEAVLALNSLQSNKSVIERIRKDREVDPRKNVRETEKYLNDVGYDVSSLDALNVIHVSGTKGKGSTCALAESILRRHGHRTGFFSSPHLLHVQERIRIDGQPISEQKFAHYFWKVYNKIAAQGDTFPAYFKFLTVMAYTVFIEEKVDVALIEVGIGGAYDCTNIIKNPVICAITTLDYDHMSILGNTLEEIAWNKAGIFKAGSIGLTLPQNPGALGVLCRRAHELGCPLAMVPSLDQYKLPTDHHGDSLQSGIAGLHQILNISMAMQIARLWIARMGKGEKDGGLGFEIQQLVPVSTLNSPGPTSSISDSDKREEVFDKKTDATYHLPILPSFTISQQFSQGVKDCFWPGRSHTIDLDKVAYYLDGAHTPKSIQFCAQWFQSASSTAKSSVQQPEETDNEPYKILLFHCTADRKPETLLPYMLTCDFDEAIFCPPYSEAKVDPKSSQANFMTDRQSQINRSIQNRSCWLRIAAKSGKSLRSAEFTCIPHAVEHISQVTESNHRERGQKTAVLVTGSLHLVGSVLGVVAPRSIQIT